MSAELSESTEHPSNWRRNVALLAMILTAGIFRWVPHPINFTPIGAMALFGGACYAQRGLAFLLPMAALAVGDLATGVHILMPAVYLSFAVNVLLGRWLRSRRTVWNTAAVTLVGAVQFFIVTNLATWWVFYPHSVDGLISCFILALPCFQNTLAGDAVFTGLLFGALAITEWHLPFVREPALRPLAA